MTSPIFRHRLTEAFISSIVTGCQTGRSSQPLFCSAYNLVCSTSNCHRLILFGIKPEVFYNYYWKTIFSHASASMKDLLIFESETSLFSTKSSFDKMKHPIFQILTYHSWRNRLTSLLLSLLNSILIFIASFLLDSSTSKILFNDDTPFFYDFVS